MVEEALRALLRSDQDRDTQSVEPLPSYGQPGGRFLVDLRDKDAVWAILDGAR